MEPEMMHVTWREYFDQRLVDLDNRLAAEERTVDVRLRGMDKALSLAETAQDKRWDAANEFRASLNDILNRGVQRVEFDGLRERVNRMIDRPEHEALCTQVQVLNDARVRLEAKAAQYDVTVASVALLNESKARLEGKASQSSVTVAYVLSGISLAIGVIGIAMRFLGM